MKYPILSLVLAGFLLSGCTSMERLDNVRSSAEKLIDTAGAAVESAAMNTTAATQPASGLLTREEARDIALKDAGFTADQVSWLRTEYEVDDGVPQYEVDFHQGTWEYSYEIDARTGAILSYDRDD